MNGGKTEVAVWLAGVGASITETNNVSDNKLVMRHYQVSQSVSQSVSQLISFYNVLLLSLMSGGEDCSGRG